jgi:hypothetical protein
MRRGTNIVRDRELEGSSRSAELATALAQIACPELLEAIVHGVSLLHFTGGQIFIAGVRNKYRVTTLRNELGNVVAEERTLLEDRREPGNYETDGYVFHYDHIATALRGARKEPDSAFPADPNEGARVEEEEEAKVAEAPTPASAEPEPVAEPDEEPADVVARETAELNENSPGESAFEGG